MLAVDQIEHRLFDEVCADRELLRVHTDPALLGTAREGVMVFEGHRLVAANRCPLGVFGLEWNELGRRRYDELFSGAFPRVGPTGGLRDHYGTCCTRSATRAATPTPVIDAPLAHQLARATRLLDADIPVLLQGETGTDTSKEIFTRELHRRSARRDASFVAINCLALPESLIVSVLFGYASGAFTGARREGSPGLLRQADGGVLFLDEIGDLRLAMQCRLLRVLKDVRSSLSVAHAPRRSHCDLDVAVAQHAFRADLYDRIAHTCVRLPLLRDRAAPADLIE